MTQPGLLVFPTQIVARTTKHVIVLAARLTLRPLSLIPSHRIQILTPSRSERQCSTDVVSPQDNVSR